MRDCPTFIYLVQRSEGKFEAPLLLSQPFRNRLPHDPALAPVDAVGDLVHTGDKVIWKLGGNYTSVVGHLTHQFKEIKTNMVQYEPIKAYQQHSIVGC